MKSCKEHTKLVSSIRRIERAVYILIGLIVGSGIVEVVKLLP